MPDRPLAQALSREPPIITRFVARQLAAARLPLPGGRRTPAWLGPIVVPFAPVALDLLLRLVDVEYSWRGLAWTASGAILVATLLLSADWGWPHVKEIAEPLELMLGTVPGDAAGHSLPAAVLAEHRAYIDSVKQRLATRWWQYPLCVITALGALVGIWFASRALPDSTLGPPYYLMLFVLGMLGTDCVMWMIRVPLIIIRPLTKLTTLRVVMHSPTTTPAIRQMGSVAAMTALRSGIGFFLLGLPLFWTVVSAKHDGRHASHVEHLAYASILPLAVTAAVVIYVTFVPQFWLSQIVGHQRNRILDELAKELPEEGAANLLEDETAKVMTLYDRLAGTTTETAAARVIARRMLAVFAVLLPQLFVVIGKLLKLG